jgi:hypothetical protein
MPKVIANQLLVYNDTRHATGVRWLLPFWKVGAGFLSLISAGKQPIKRVLEVTAGPARNCPWGVMRMGRVGFGKLCVHF